MGAVLTVTALCSKSCGEPDCLGGNCGAAGHAPVEDAEQKVKIKRLKQCGFTRRSANRRLPSQRSFSSFFMRLTITASSCARSGLTARAKRWLSSNSSNAAKLSL
jgi:hypothetical protein